VCSKVDFSHYSLRAVERGQQLKNYWHTAHLPPHGVVSKHLREKNDAANFGMGDGFIQCIGFALIDVVQYGCLVRN